MAEPGGQPIALTVLKGGINRLRVRAGASPSSLYDLVNARLTIDGSVVPREGTIRNATLNSNTSGLVWFAGAFQVFATSTQTVPAGYNVNIVVGPNGASDGISFVWFSKPFLGFLYIVVEYVSGAIAHFWLQSGGVWTASTTFQVGAIRSPTVPNGYAYQAVRDALKNPTWTPETFVSVNQIMEPTVANGYMYKATAVSGTNPHTGEVEPTWPTVTPWTIQEFGDYASAGLAAAAVSATAPLSTNITDRYGNSQDVASPASAKSSTVGAVTILPAVTGILAPWKAGAIYTTGSVVVPTTGQGAVIGAIPNGDFEAGNDGNWLFSGSGQAWQIGALGVPYQGTYQAINAPGTTSALLTMNTFGVCKPGQTINASYYLTTGTSSGTAIQVSMKMNWYSDAAATVLISTVDGGANTSHSAWTQFKHAFVAPATAITCKVAMHAASGTSSRDTAGIDLIAWDLETPIATTNFIYEAVQVGPGTSASNEPTWPIIDGNTVVDNTVTWEAVGSSIINWTGSPIEQSGAVEPTWPTVVGTSVSDGNMSWICISRQITDPKLPASVVVALGASKIFVGDKDIVAFSASVNPTDYSSANNAGFLPTGLNNYGNNDVAVLVLYRGNLLCINSGGYQMWQIDPDPANMALLDAQPVGSAWTLGAQSVANDTLMLTNLGLRNVGTTGATANMATGQLGQPIDPLIQAAIAAGTYYPTSLYYPARGQEWTIFGPQAFVLTVNGASQKSWSRYVFPDEIKYWTLKGEVLYLRTAGNLVWQLDANTLIDDTHIAAVPAQAAVVLLLHFDGAIGSQNFVDSSAVGNVVTPIDAGAVIGGVGPKFGIGNFPQSALWTYSAIGEYVYAPIVAASPLDVASGSADFTIEGWFYTFTASYAENQFANFGAPLGGTQDQGISFVSDIGSVLTVIPPTGTDATSAFGNLITANAWHHFALVRASGAVTLYLDGIGGPPQTDWTCTLPASAAFWIGYGPGGAGGGQANITLDEFRVSNSAQYTTNFTPPTAAFPNGTVPASTGFSCVMQWPYLDLTKMGYQKEMVGFDIAGTGDVTVQFGWDETDLTSFSDNAGFATSLSVTAPYELTTADTLPGQPIAMPLSAVSYSIILTWKPNQAWSWQAVQLYAIPG